MRRIYWKTVLLLRVGVCKFIETIGAGQTIPLQGQSLIMTTQHALLMCLNSISHSPSGFVLTSSSSWKEVGNPQCWRSPGWPDGPSGPGGTSSARQVWVATDRRAMLCQPARPTTLSPITDFSLTLAEGTLYITGEEQWEGSVTVLLLSKPFIILLSEDRICPLRYAVSSERPQYTPPLSCRLCIPLLACGE